MEWDNFENNDGGFNWSIQNNPLSGIMLDLWGVYFTTPEIGIITGENGTILRTTDGGNLWNTVGGNSITRFWSVSFENSLTGMIAGDSRVVGVIYKTNDAGITWTKISNDTMSGLFGIDMVEPDAAFAVGLGGEILYTNSGGVVSIKELNQLNERDNFFLFQNYPNPFNSKTIINYAVPMVEPGQTSTSLSNNIPTIQLKIYDILGNEIATLVNEQKASGNYTVEFDASHLSSGVYFYRLNAGSFTKTKKLILLR